LEGSGSILRGWPNSSPMNEHILVVDDEAWVLQTVREYLGSSGFSVATASDGPGALAEFAAREPALVILDWMLRAWMGLKLLGAFASNPMCRSSC